MFGVKFLPSISRSKATLALSAGDCYVALSCSNLIQRCAVSHTVTATY